MPDDYAHDLRDKVLSEQPESATATWTGEEMVVTFRSRPEKVDYGVPGSPTWDEYHDITIASLTILGVEVDPDTLPKDLVNRIINQADMVDWAA